MAPPLKKTPVQPYCAICMLKTSYKVLGLATGHSTGEAIEDEGMRRLHMRVISGLLGILEGFSEDSIPLFVANDMFRKIKVSTGNEDPYVEIKKRSNEICLGVEARVREVVQQAGGTKERLFAALMASIAGNNIDFVTGGHTFEVTRENLVKEVEKTLEKGAKLDHFDALWDALQERKRCVYIHDNAGEILFDKLVIEILVDMGVEVVSVVKGGPVANDAVMTDALMVGLDKVANKIVTTGSDSLGFHLDESSPEFARALEGGPVVIAKGQSNFEAYHVFQDREEIGGNPNFFLVLKLKCLPCAKLAGAELGDNLIWKVNDGS
ncbi:MAG: damage-control phosphatase ARMT1 family protein [Promethearchaeota archaeon]